MQRRQRQFVMIVEGLGQPLGQLACGVVVDVDQGGDAVALGVERLAGLADAGARQVADRLGAVLVAAGGDDAVELGHQLVIDGDGHALHASLAIQVSLRAARGPALRLSSVLVRSRPLANVPSVPARPGYRAALPRRRAIRPSCRRAKASPPG